MKMRIGMLKVGLAPGVSFFLLRTARCSTSRLPSLVRARDAFGGPGRGWLIVLALPPRARASRPLAAHAAYCLMPVSSSRSMSDKIDGIIAKLLGARESEPGHPTQRMTVSSSFNVSGPGSRLQAGSDPATLACLPSVRRKARHERGSDGGRGHLPHRRVHHNHGQPARAAGVGGAHPDRGRHPWPVPRPAAAL